MLKICPIEKYIQSHTFIKQQLKSILYTSKVQIVLQLIFKSTKKAEEKQNFKSYNKIFMYLFYCNVYIITKKYFYN